MRIPKYPEKRELRVLVCNDNNKSEEEKMFSCWSRRERERDEAIKKKSSPAEADMRLPICRQRDEPMTKYEREKKPEGRHALPAEMQLAQQLDNNQLMFSFVLRYLLILSKMIS